MSTIHFIPVQTLCFHYELEVSFISDLGELGLIRIETIESVPHMHEDSLSRLEKSIRMHRDLGLDPEGIDLVFQLLEKIDALNAELDAVKSRLRLYE